MKEAGRKSALSATLLALLALFSANTMGARYMEDMPIVQFDEQDKNLLIETINTFLESAEDGSSTEWRNPETGNGGEIRIKNSFTKDGTSCRRVWITNRAGEDTGSGTYIFCKATDGSWKVLE